MSEPIKVCKDHQVFSEGCAVCQLLRDRQALVSSFWYVSLCCEGPFLGGPMMYGSEPPPPKIATNEEGMKIRLDHILEVASTMVDNYGGSGFKRLWDSAKHNA